jgi:hypothetical protein
MTDQAAFLRAIVEYRHDQPLWHSRRRSGCWKCDLTYSKKYEWLHFNRWFGNFLRRQRKHLEL